MSRHDETIGRMPNPTEYFLEWNAEQKTFCYWSKDESETKPFPLPFTFLALKFVNSITGFNEGTKQGIFSNEVTDTRYEHFRVSFRDGSFLASGLYADIKDEVKAAGGKYTRSIYAMTPKGAIINVRLKGAQMVNFSSIEKYGNRWQDEFIQVAAFETKIYKEGEKETEYTVPKFSFGGSLTPDHEKKAGKAYDLIIQYFNSKPAQSASQANTRPAQQPAAAASMPVSSNVFAGKLAAGQADDNDDLPF